MMCSLSFVYLYILAIVIWLVHVDVVFSQDFDDESPCVDDPNYYLDADVKCNHQEFFQQTDVKPIKERNDLKDYHNIASCCPEHGFIYQDFCDEENEAHVCVQKDKANGNTKNYIYEFSCPKGCVEYKSRKLDDPFVIMNPNGTVSLNQTHRNVKYFRVEKYCLGYICDEKSEKWTVGIDMCICYDDQLLEKKFGKQYKRCCNDSEFMSSMVGQKRIECTPRPDLKSSIATSTGENERLTCNTPLKFKKLHGFGKNGIEEKGHEHGKLDTDGKCLALTFTPAADLTKTKENVTFKISESNYCVGINVLSLPTLGHNVGAFYHFQPELAYCQSSVEPCSNNSNVIIKTCGCPKTRMYVKGSGKDLECKVMSADVKRQLLNNYELPLADNEKLFKSEAFTDVQFKNFKSVTQDKTSIDYETCDDGMSTENMLDPCSNSDESFSIDYDAKTSKTRLVLDNTMEAFKKYCIVVNDDLTYSANICRKNNVGVSTRERVNVAFLIISSILLVATIVVYTYHKKLLTDYTRIMRHFAFVLLITYILMAINKLVHLGDVGSRGLCQFTGFAIYYLLVCSFTLMSAMSVFTWNKIRSHSKQRMLERFYGRSEEKFQQILVISSYGFSLLMTLIALVFELAGPNCSKYRPKFGAVKPSGTRSCFFHERAAKGVWLFFPMGIAIIINFATFISIVAVIMKKNKSIKQFKMQKKKDDNLGQAFMYLKMFLGMGFVWIMEIISGALGSSVHEAWWYLFDGINALQGLWVFIIFVCRRDVYKLILKSVGYDTSVTKSGKKTNKAIRMNKRNAGQSGSEIPSSMVTSGAGKQTAFTNISLNEPTEKDSMAPGNNV